MASTETPQTSAAVIPSDTVPAPYMTPDGLKSYGNPTTSAGLHINLVSDSSVSSAPSGWLAAVQQAAAIIEQNFSDPVTVNLRIGYGSFNNVADPTLVGSGGAYANSLAGTTGNYTTVTGWLVGDRTTTDDYNSYNALPNNSSSFPGGANNFYVPNAELRALGQLANNSTVDGAAAFGTGISNTDLVNVALHELTHAMGRLSLAYTPGSAPVIADWFRFGSAGNFQWTENSSGASPSYFSIDNGATKIADFGQSSDYSDFLNSGVQGGDDPFNEFYSGGGGTLRSLTTADLREMDVIGFNRVDDYTQNHTTTGVLSVNGAGVTGTITPGGDEDWFRVTLTAGVAYRFDERGSPSSGGTLPDSLIRLYNSSSALITSNDDGGVGFDSSLFYTATSSGTYYVDAAAFGGNIGTYTVSAVTDDYNNTSETLGTMTVNAPKTGAIETSGDRDWFAITLVAGTSYRLDERGSPSGGGTLPDTSVALYNSASTLVASDDDGYLNDTASFSLESELFYTATYSGTYYVSAGAFSTNTGTYTTLVTTDDYSASPLHAGSIGVTGSSTGSIETIGDKDWFAVSLVAGQTYTFRDRGALSGYGTLNDPYFSLKNNSGTQVASNDDYFGLESRLVYTATYTGTYYVDAGAFGTGTYSVSVIHGNETQRQGDFNSDGVSDVLFRNNSTGAYGFEALTTGGVSTWHAVGGSSPSYAAVGTGDFNGDGISDVLFRNNATGDYGFQALTSGGTAVWHYVGLSNTSYAVVGTGDFNSDGVSDVLFRNNSTGAYGFEALTTGGVSTWHAVGGSSPSYAAVGTGDFNGDGISDVLFRNNATGDYGFQALTSGGTAVWHHVGLSNTSYTVAGTGDFNGDGVSDVLFRNSSTGAYGYESLTTGGGSAWHPFAAFDPSYSVAAVGDYNGDGVADVLFRNAATGSYGFETLSGASATWHLVGASNASYSVIST